MEEEEEGRVMRLNEQGSEEGSEEGSLWYAWLSARDDAREEAVSAAGVEVHPPGSTHILDNGVVVPLLQFGTGGLHPHQVGRGKRAFR